MVLCGIWQYFLLISRTLLYGFSLVYKFWIYISIFINVSYSPYWLIEMPLELDSVMFLSWFKLLLYSTSNGYKRHGWIMGRTFIKINPIYPTSKRHPCAIPLLYPGSWNSHRIIFGSWHSLMALLLGLKPKKGHQSIVYTFPWDSTLTSWSLICPGNLF